MAVFRVDPKRLEVVLLRAVEVLPVSLEEHAQVAVGDGTLRVELECPAVVLLSAVDVLPVVREERTKVAWASTSFGSISIALR